MNDQTQHEGQNQQNNSVMTFRATPKMIFWVGLACGIVTAAVVGFFILLGMFLSGDKKLFADNDPADNNVPYEDPSGDPDPANIVVADVGASDHVFGKQDAPITIVEFSDLECPYCARFHPTMEQVMKEYEGQVRWVYRHFPLESIHPTARTRAEASECMANQKGNDAFWKYISRIFTDGAGSKEQLTSLAVELGADQNKFKTCLDNREFSDKVESDAAQAQAAGAQGTPYSVIVKGEQKIPLSGAASYSQISSILDSLK